MDFKSHDIGDISELEITLALTKAGYHVFRPTITRNLRFDLVLVDKDNNLLKIQCKTGRLKDNGSISASACSAHYGYTRVDGTTYGRQDYSKDVDFIAIFCPENNKSYLIPIAECPKTTITLRTEKPANNCYRGVRLATDYEIKKEPIGKAVYSPGKEPVNMSCVVCGKQTQKRATYCSQTCYNTNHPQVVSHPCPECNMETKNDAYCSSECSSKGRRKTERPSKEILSAELKQYSYVALGRKYGVSDNAIRKWARQYELIN